MLTLKIDPHINFLKTLPEVLQHGASLKLIEGNVGVCPGLRIIISRFSENQDGGVGRHTAPPHTTRTDRKPNGKEVQHQVDKK